MKKIKEDKNWKYYSPIKLGKKNVTNIKRGKHDKNYWEFTYNKKKMSGVSKTNEHFKRNLAYRIKSQLGKSSKYKFK